MELNLVEDAGESELRGSGAVDQHILLAAAPLA
jgi:hypothetical protein